MKKYMFLLIAISTYTLKIAPAQDCYHLIWADEFNNEGKPSSENWSYDLGASGWGNNELQEYTNSSLNSYVEDGKLIITAIKQNNKWTSARLVTKNKADFLYGRMEIRAKLPAGTGTWPAIWMLPTDWEYGNWPASGEIDIMEHVGFDPGNVHATVHTGAYNGSLGTQVGKSIQVPDFDTAFHTYSIEWTKDKIDAFLDNEKYFTFENDHSGNTDTWPFDKKFHFILNIAMGGNWGGQQGVDPELSKLSMEVDYVRVYAQDDKPVISGNSVAKPGETLTFELPFTSGASYTWNLPEDARIQNGAGSHHITVIWGKTSGKVNATIVKPCGQVTAQPFEVTIK